MLAPQGDQPMHLRHVFSVLAPLKHSTQELASLREAHCIVALVELRNAGKVLAYCLNLCNSAQVRSLWEE